MTDAFVPNGGGGGDPPPPGDDLTCFWCEVAVGVGTILLCIAVIWWFPPAVVSLDLSDNNLFSIPKQLKKLLKLQEVNLAWNNIANIKNITEIVEKLRYLSRLDLSHNNIKVLSGNIEQLEQLRHLKWGNNLT